MVFNNLLPVRIYQVNLRWRESVQMPFFHQAVVTAFVRTLLKSSHKQFFQLALHTPESGKTDYEAEDTYTFYINQFGDNFRQIETLFGLLDALPRSAQQAGCYGLMADNIELTSIRDALSGELLADPQHAGVIDPESLQAQAEAFQNYSPWQVQLEFISPVRLKPLNPDGEKRKNSKTLCQNGEQVCHELLFNRVFDACATLQQQLFEHQDRATRPLPPEAWVKDSDLFWADAFYQGQERNAKELSGLLGSITLALPPLSDEQWQMLILGQYTGIGENRRFGCGRYRLLTQDGQCLMPELTRSNPLIQEAITLNELEESWHHEFDKLTDEHKAWEQSRENLPDTLYRCWHLDYWPELLHPRLLQQAGKKERLLLLPPFPDKVIHKTISRWLSDSLDQLYSKSSYGYRKGYSRLGAKDRIIHLVRKGYKYALDADITDFFPSVNTNRILGRLAALYGQDPLWQLLERFLHCQIDRQNLPAGYEHHVNQGLNLGTSLSPVLANLMLDHLDSVLNNMDYELVRYADDFLVLCKHKQQAEDARVLIEQLLKQHDLQLNAEKTKVRSFASGIYFLGYLFINDTVIPAKGEHKPKNRPPEVLLPKFDPADSDNPNGTHLFYQDMAQQTLCLTGDNAFITLDQHRWVIEKKDEVVADIPIKHLSTVVLFGKHQITTQALTQAMEQGVSIHFASGFGRYQGCASQIEHNPGFHLQQAAHFSQPENQLDFARALVAARIRSQKEVLRNRKVNEPGLDQALEKLKRITTLDQCLGTEGNATKLYWEAFRSQIPDDWEFTHREKRHAKDPINSMLSFGYSLLYSHTDSLLRSKGLFPTLGGYHQSRGTHSALASDMMEPFRYLVERAVLSTIKTGQIKRNQFFINKGQCWLDKNARQFWCRYLVDQLQKPQFTDPEGKKRSALDQIQQQNHNLKQWINGDIERFAPWQPR
ncbi:CRISPR-associated endonuclease Cas1 [Oceanospirillum beijerinckii]|uniref:CRISPR-associated endonuclease Cas1 n=1 Tax=Oceanospirillum beijerinckii TaxID=64976 RepID=UPI000421C7A0|nr:CRISPR-associated endonuclease Cas1 [Oceanospirillum beijerinckii]